MKKSFRFLLLACVSFIGLAFAAPALAAYGPSLTIEQTSYKLGAPTTVDTFIFAPPNDDPTAKITIFSPAGYSANITQAPGTKIGRVVAIVKAKQLANALLPLTGNVVVGNPADPMIAAASTRCTGSPTNQAVWILNGTLQGQAIPIPVFVNKVGPYLVQQVCLPSPDVPAPAGAAFGAQLVSADFTASGVFRNASASKGYDWAGDFTPYTPGTATPNPAGTVEWRTYVGLPASLSFKRLTSKTGVKFGGVLRMAGLDPTGVRVRLYYGKKANPAPNALHGSYKGVKIARSGKLPRTGKYTASRQRPKVKTFFQARFENYVTKCEGPSPSNQPIPCKGEDLAPLTSGQIMVLPSKKKR